MSSIYYFNIKNGFRYSFGLFRRIRRFSATAGIVLLTPANFYHFQRTKFNFQPLSFTFEAFDKKLAETKIVARVNVKKIKAKKQQKDF